MAYRAATRSQRSAADFLPARLSLASLRRAAANCKGCELYRRATQTVFGAGPASARIVMVGEQPGDEEDRKGRPFVGPAGRLLDELLGEAGITRRDIYLTNAVKHFKWGPRGKRRLHAKPNSRETFACQPWLEAELEVIAPRLIVCLGATASQQILGASFRLTRNHGTVIDRGSATPVLATYHPSAVLRAPPERRSAMRKELTADLRVAAKFISKGSTESRHAF